MLMRPKWSALLKPSLSCTTTRRLIRIRPSRLRPSQPQPEAKHISQPFTNDTTKSGGKEHIKSFQAPKEPWEYYRYHALPEEVFAVRLMELKPGTGEIHCELHNAHLGNERVSYTALSYTWGTQILQQYIWCNGKVLPVTQNLFDALKQLRNQQNSVMLWIDAICINQANDDERSHQVNLMRHIFNRAVKVVVWLGEEHAQTKRAFSFIEKIAASTAESLPDMHTFRSWSPNGLSHRGLPPFTDPQWNSILQFFQAPYFERIWVIQELVVSSDAIVRHGTSTIAWKHVAHVARLVLSSVFRRAYNTACLPDTKVSRRDPVFAKTIANIHLASLDQPSNPAMSLSELLWVSRRFKASDPKDKIVAIYGLANTSLSGKSHELSSASITLPSHPYSIPTGSLYTHVTGSLLARSADLSLLSSVEDISRRSPQFLALPSWVPDYSVWHGVMSFGFPFRNRTFRACGPYTSPSVHWSPSFPQTLRLQCAPVDEVTEIFPGCYDTRTEVSQILLSWLSALEDRLDAGSISIDGFWRTILGDRVGRLSPATRRHGANMAAFLSLISESSERDVPARRHWEPLLEILPKGTRLETAKRHFENTVEGFASRRRMFVTRGGRLGLGPRSVLVGDRVLVARGGRVPLLVRRGVEGWRLVGEGFVEGVMWGEAVGGKSESETGARAGVGEGEGNGELREWFEIR
ncbi:MAG: hypothetical protein MMC23_006837 [Stictis urceolatum]|nr:hypothetical protein [Stictis urceolata]